MAFYLLSMPQIWPFPFILLSEIFKDSTIPWKIKSKFWAWVTTLNDPDPARTRRVRQAIISWAYVLATLNYGPPPMHDISSVLLRFGRWEDVLSFLFQQTPLHPARSNSWVVLLCILMALYSNYPIVLSLFDTYHSSSGFLTCRNYLLVSINPLSWCLARRRHLGEVVWKDEWTTKIGVGFVQDDWFFLFIHSAHWFCSANFPEFSNSYRDCIHASWCGMAISDSSRVGEVGGM